MEPNVFNSIMLLTFLLPTYVRIDKLKSNLPIIIVFTLLFFLVYKYQDILLQILRLLPGLFGCVIFILYFFKNIKSFDNSWNVQKFWNRAVNDIQKLIIKLRIIINKGNVTIIRIFDLDRLQYLKNEIIKE